MILERPNHLKSLKSSGWRIWRASGSGCELLVPLNRSTSCLESGFWKSHLVFGWNTCADAALILGKPAWLVTFFSRWNAVSINIQRFRWTWAVRIEAWYFGHRWSRGRSRAGRGGVPFCPVAATSEFVRMRRKSHAWWTWTPTSHWRPNGRMGYRKHPKTAHLFKHFEW